MTLRALLHHLLILLHAQFKRTKLPLWFAQQYKLQIRYGYMLLVLVN